VTAEARIRPLRPSDHAPLIAVIDEWRMGFRLEPGDAYVGDIPVATGYDGPGQDRVRFVRDLPS
jgi:hypothetical protein